MRWFDWFAGTRESVAESPPPPVPPALKMPVIAGAESVSLPAAPCPESVDSSPEPLANRSRHLSIEMQGARLVRDAARSGRVLVHVAPAAHAHRLLVWCQQEGNPGQPAAGYKIIYEDLMVEYLSMCDALGWHPVVSWITVARSFTPLTGGKKYRRAYNPRTGLNDAKERIYRIPGVAARQVPKAGRPVTLPGRAHAREAA